MIIKSWNKAMSEHTPVAYIPGSTMRNLLFKGIVFFVFFVQTLGFEFLSNIVVLSFLPFFLGRLKFPMGVVVTIILLGLLLIPFYLITANGVYVKYWTFTIRMSILVILVNHIYTVKLKSFELKPILEKIFYVHILCIIVCFLSPRINGIVTNIFAYSLRETNFRVSGFFSGFDMVSFFIVVYLAYEYLSARNLLSTNLLIKLFLGAFAIFQSGRFGVIPLAIFVFFLFIKFKNIKWVLLAIPLIIAIFSSGVLDNQFENITSTFNMLQVAVDDLDMVDNSFFDGKEIEGQYNQSPLTWYFEFVKPFKEIGNYLSPGKLYVVDSGPSFFVLNFGLFLAVFFYIFYFRIFKSVTRKQIPFLVVVIILAVDLKFRLLYSLMPLMWLTVNHFSYMQQLEKFKPKSA
jgi:hypothetical protein